MCFCIADAVAWVVVGVLVVVIIIVSIGIYFACKLRGPETAPSTTAGKFEPSQPIGAMPQLREGTRKLEACAPASRGVW